jgi:uncharacterized membrane protein (DUF373 family)
MTRTAPVTENPHEPEGEGELPPRLGLGVRPGDVRQLAGGIGAAETAIYLVVALMLVAAAVFTMVGTVIDLVEGSGSRAISDTGLFLLDRVLLMFIVAELLYTLRVVNFGGRILVEPFLFIGLIAVVRKVLVVAAEADQNELKAIDVLIEIGALAGLALVLAIAIYLLRRSAATAGG